MKKESLNVLCNDVDDVFHLAAKIALDNQKPDEVYAVNITDTKNIIEQTLRDTFNWYDENKYLT